MSEEYKVVVTGGGTGGHVFPLIAVIREMKRIMPTGLDLCYMGPSDKWAKLYISEEDVRIKTILSGKLRRYITPKSIALNIVDIFKLGIGLFQSLFILLFMSPDLVFSKGGFGSLPVVLTAKLLGIPIFNHESDSVPGLANKIGSKMALKTFTSFPQTELINPRKTVLTGNPIRRELFGGSKERSKEVFELTGKRPILFVFPSSQGAQRINDLILLVLPQLLRRFEIIHQCGTQNFQDVKNEARVVMEEGQERFYHPIAFLNEQRLREAYFAADLVLTRAGSGNIFECAALKKATILIPLPESAQGHQVKNAYRLDQMDAAVVLEEESLRPQFFVNKVNYLIDHTDEIERLEKKIGEFAKPRAAKEIAHYLLEYLMI